MNFHFDFFCGTVPAIGENLGEDSMIRVGLYPLRTDGIPVDVEVGIVYGIVFVSTGGHLSERRRVEKFTPAECGLKQVAVALAAVHTSGADT